MNYYYDVCLNFLENNTLFYDWCNEDNIEFFRVIPLIRIDSDTLNDFINNDITISKDILSLIENKAKKRGKTPKYVAIFADRHSSIALEFNENGNSIFRSFLPIDEDINITELLYNQDITNISYKKRKKRVYNPFLRSDDEVKRVILTEINTLNKNKEYLKLKYLYMELFNKEPTCKESITDEIKKHITSHISNEEMKLYELIKLSYNKV